MRVSADGQATLKLNEADRCSGCAGTCMWRRANSSTLRGPFACVGVLSPGLAVELSLTGRCLLLGALAVYGLPLLGLLAGAGAGALIGGSDVAVLVGVLAGVGVAFALTSGLRRRIERMVLTGIELKRLL